MISSVEEIHGSILGIAARIANQNWNGTPTYRLGERFNAERRRQRQAAGTIFRPEPQDGLVLSVDPIVTTRMTDEQISDMHQIGVNAVKEAISENPHLLTALILGEAREGRNYFDRYA